MSEIFTSLPQALDFLQEQQKYSQAEASVPFHNLPEHQCFYQDSRVQVLDCRKLDDNTGELQ